MASGRLNTGEAHSFLRREGWLRAVLDLVSVAVVLAEPGHGEVLFANRAAHEMAGGRFPFARSFAEYVEVYRLYDASGRPLAQHEYPAVRAIRGEVIEGVEFAWRLPDRTRRVLVSARRFDAMYGRPPVVILIFQDLTANEQARAVLRSFEQRMALFFRRNPLAAIVWNPALEVVEWNESASRMFGWSADEARGRHGSFILPESEREYIVCDVWQGLLRRTSGERSTNENVTRDGRRILCEWYNTPLFDESGQVIGVASLVEDVTSQRHAEAERARLYREAQEAVRVRDDFLASASHQLRTPLTPLLLRLEVLRRTLGDPAACRQVDRALASAHRLECLVNDLLDVPHIAAGTLALARAPADLRLLVGEALAPFRDVSARHTIVYEPPPAPVVAAVDRARLEQVVASLVENAIKYSPTGGEVRVSVTASAGTARIEVVDHGIGIPVDQQPILFERHFRGRNAPHESYAGFGLGLYISSAIVERHGGRIFVESEPGRGSTFVVELPLAPPPCGLDDMP
ncbi:PAS domain-containing sensor histidine kinase [Nannocystis sp. SCPEA4]|uniref:sensor histidine kinase n=1 Tax=Nannocystis sp. SCPEA4 TaxID=2996787 RepID=UPI002270E4CD|nr:PAS domain-containing sensor histidine kinase [Nannocystis sp. SCPEA4]MCY1054358.1 PAS domain-containing sensor histidine kinase [Nannocystis sp. SCPEA4]